MLPVEGFAMIPGKGIRAQAGGKIILCGNSAYLQDNGIPVDGKIVRTMEELRKQGKATILIANSETCMGMVALSDILRQTVKDMVDELHGMKTNVVLLTGDHAQTADYFAEQAGIKKVYSELLPAQKVDRIKEIQDGGHFVCMIGDGVNDAPALKIANVGVAMGTMGSDIALEAADIALMGDDIAKIPYLKRLSNETIRSIKFNITLAMLINFVAVTLSVMGTLTPVTGALVHNAGSVLVVLNASLLYDKKLI